MCVDIRDDIVVRWFINLFRGHVQVLIWHNTVEEWTNPGRSIQIVGYTMYLPCNFAQEFLGKMITIFVEDIVAIGEEALTHAWN